MDGNILVPFTLVFLFLVIFGTFGIISRRKRLRKLYEQNMRGVHELISKVGRFETRVESFISELTKDQTVENAIRRETTLDMEATALVFEIRRVENKDRDRWFSSYSWMSKGDYTALENRVINAMEHVEVLAKQIYDHNKKKIE